MKSIWRKCKRALVVALSIALVGNSVDMSMLYAQAENEPVIESVSGNEQTQGGTSGEEQTQGSTSDSGQAATGQGTVSGNNIEAVSGGDAQYSSMEYFQLPSVETSAIPMGFFSLSNGTVDLASGNHANWIDRIDLSDAAFAKEFYNNLVEWTDNDGTNDLLIDDAGFTMEASETAKTVTITSVSGTLTGTDATEAKVVAKAQEIYNTYASFLMAAADAFDRDHPEVFWLNGDRIIGASQSAEITEGVEATYTIELSLLLKGTVTVDNVPVDFDIRATNYQSEAAITAGITARDARVKALVDAVANKNVYEKVQYFNNQLTATNEYNTGSDLNAIDNACRECISALSGKTGADGPVCEGYARAFKVLCDKAGIPCVLVDGTANNGSTTESHMWNYVQMDDNKWYAVDVTWNDPKGGDTGAVSGGEYEAWLLVGADTEINNMKFSASHPMTNKASSTGVAFTNGPELNGAKYTNLVAEVTPENGTATTYEDITSAWSAAMVSSGSTLKLLKNVSVENYLIATAAVTVDLNGCVMDLDGNKIEVAEGASFTVCDCGTDGEITGTNSQIQVNEGGSLTLKSGKITVANGVYIYPTGKFQMDGGSIAATSSCCVVNHGTFQLAGGIIEETANYEAVRNEADAIFEMTDGTIQENADREVVNNYGTMTVSGGTIQGAEEETYENFQAIVNGGTLRVSGTPTITGGGTAAAIYNGADTTFELSGAPVLTGKGETGDIELYNSTITLTGALTGTDNTYSISLYGEDGGAAVGVFAEGTDDYTIQQTDREKFVSADSTYIVRQVENQLLIGDVPHVHEGTDAMTFERKWENAAVNSQGYYTTGRYYLTEDTTATEYITISGQVTLCLNGHTLDLGNYAIQVRGGASFTVCDCGTDGEITGTEASQIVVEGGGSFTLESGKITTVCGVGIDAAGGFQMNGGSIAVANGFVVYNNGTFLLTDGTLLGSTESCVVENQGIFEMTGGKIQGNTNSQVVSNDGTMTISGGTIQGAENEEYADAEAILNSGTLHVSGTPTITGGGTAAAIYNNSAATLELSGAPVLTGKGEEGDIVLYNSTITLTGELTGTDTYSISLYKNGSVAKGVFANAGSDYTITESDRAYFSSIAGYEVLWENGALKLGFTPHEHTGETFEDKLLAANDTVTAGTYYLAEDVTAENVIYIEGDVKLCLNGHTLDMGAEYIDVEPGATLTICDCSAEQTGKITGEGVSTIINDGIFLLESGVLENTAESDGEVICNEGTATVKGGMLWATGTDSYGIYNSGSLQLSAGTIEVPDGKGVFCEEDSYTGLSGAPVITSGICDFELFEYVSIDVTGKLTGTDTYTLDYQGEVPDKIANVAMEVSAEECAARFESVDETLEVSVDGTFLRLDYRKADIPVSIVAWDDEENQYNTRGYVDVRLYSGDDCVDILGLNEENLWSGAFDDIYLYDANGKIEYTIKVIEDKYKADITGSVSEGFAIDMSLKHRHELAFVNVTPDGEVTTEVTSVLELRCFEEDGESCDWIAQSLQVLPPASTQYDGAVKEATSIVTLDTGAISEIQYFVQEGSSWTAIEAEQVVDVGTYKAQVTVRDGEKSNVAEVIFEIEPTVMNVQVVAYDRVYDPFVGDAGSEAVEVIGLEDVPDATISYRIDNGDWTPTIPTIKEAGNLTVEVKVTAPNYEDYTETVEAYMAPFELGACELVLEQDIYYYTGEEVKPKVLGIKGGEEFLPLTEADYEISYENNIEISEAESGSVRVTVNNHNYTGEARTGFFIYYYDGAVTMLYNGSEMVEECYNTDVAISAEGYTVSESITGPYTEQVVISGEGVGLSKTLYFKQDGTGYITYERQAIVNIDKTAPTFEGEGLGISIEDRFWNTLLNKITFGVFFNETKLVSISATDAFSGVESYYYYVDTTGSEVVLSSSELDALDAAGKFTEVVDGWFEMADDDTYVVYAYAVDWAGNKSAYICSDGVVIDTTAPVITVTEPTEAAGTLKDTSATFVVEADEEVMIGVWIIGDYSGETSGYRMNGKGLDYWESIEADMQLTESDDWQTDISYKTSAAANQAKEITITGLKPNTFYEYCIEVFDLAGNGTLFAGEEDSENPGLYTMRPITTLKTMPVFDEKPVISGTYGQELGDMTLSQPVSTNGVAGSWSIDSRDAADVPQVNGTKAYKVTFTPEDASYATITEQVLPTVAKRQVAVTIENQTVKYNEALPSFTYTATGLAAGEDADVLGIDLSTTAVKGSDVGQYPIKGTYANENYMVSFTQATLTIEQAEGKLTVETGKEAYTKSFGEEAFTLTGIQAVSGGAVVYTVADSENAVGEAVAADKVITVDENGKVTIQGAGTARVVISVPETNNYTGAEASISVVVHKAAQENAVLTKNYVYNKDTADSVDLGACVPEDAGKVSYVIKSVAGNFTEEPVIADEKLTYVISKGEKNATGKVVVEVSSENYEAFTITVDMCLKYEAAVVLKSGSEVTAKGSLTYGDALAELSFGEAVFVEEGTDTVVAGTLSWAEPDRVPTVTDTEAEWIFTPDSADYAVVSGNTAIVVNKAKQPALNIVPIGDAVYGQEGSIWFEVTGGMDGAEITVTVPKENGVVTEIGVSGAGEFYTVPVNAGKVTVTAVAVDEAGNYEDATATYELTVAPAAMEADWLSWAGDFAGEDTYTGEALTPQVKAYFIADGILTEGTDYTVTYVNNTNAYTLTEADADFDAAKAPAVVVTGKGNFTGSVKKYFVINKAQNAPNMPANTMTVENAIDKAGNASLPEGWVWQDAKQPLAEGNATLAIAVYAGADKGNYVKETVEVMITRLEEATPAPGGDSGSGTPTATPAPGGDSGSGDDSGSSTPTATQAPVATAAPAEVIASPKTDDVSMSEGWLVLMAMACVAVGMGSGMYYRRRREQ